MRFRICWVCPLRYSFIFSIFPWWCSHLYFSMNIRIAAHTPEGRLGLVRDALNLQTNSGDKCVFTVLGPPTQRHHGPPLPFEGFSLPWGGRCACASVCDGPGTPSCWSPLFRGERCSQGYDPHQRGEPVNESSPLRVMASRLRQDPRVPRETSCVDSRKERASSSPGSPPTGKRGWVCGV